MSEAVPDLIQPLESSLEGLTLEEPSYRKGPQPELEKFPALGYPPLPDAEPEDDDSCFLLGWPLHEVMENLVAAARYKLKCLEALKYLEDGAKYHHIWTTAIPRDNCKGVNPPVDSAEEDFWFLTIGSSKNKNSADGQLDKRPSEAQFRWFRDVLGKDPCWVLVERSLYTIVEPSVWARAPCCQDAKWGNEGKQAHQVDLETGKWVSYHE
ncbi:hypothetical protein GSI_15594 [Ganoderma sinense ZZ0214-1]|uniref:Uncharacterized protein n=1 Tax=Ganoderma sinense ZZ0214-1 TaxID=1077348 RepID=A0A2G8RNK7_9APHY|nr:hypothetical protein GSI_15594 [Ganoderma sinense ZZ0214-1]